MNNTSKKVLIFGNSGSGKSTLAKRLCAQHQLDHLDLDTLAWDASTSPNSAPTRKSLTDSTKLITQFTSASNGWVIEGCYADLLTLLVDDSTEMIYLNLPVELCIENAKGRPWEPHKYASKEAQDANIAMLIDWISQYDIRQDYFSALSHSELYDSYQGSKRMIINNHDKP